MLAPLLYDAWEVSQWNVPQLPMECLAAGRGP